MLCKLLSIKEPQTALQNKETNVESYFGKCKIKTPRRVLYRGDGNGYFWLSE